MVRVRAGKHGTIPVSQSARSSPSEKCIQTKLQNDTAVKHLCGMAPTSYVYVNVLSGRDPRPGSEDRDVAIPARLLTFLAQLYRCIARPRDMEDGSTSPHSRSSSEVSHVVSQGKPCKKPKSCEPCRKRKASRSCLIYHATLL